jgi:DNA mismatch repair protein MutS
MGSRCLRRWLNRPLRDQAVLNSRYDCIDALLNNNLYENVRESMRSVGDIAAITPPSRINTGGLSIIARCNKARNSGCSPILSANWSIPKQPVPAICACSTGKTANVSRNTSKSRGRADFNATRELIRSNPEFLALLQRAIIDNPPVLIRDGGVIAAGYNQQLDELRHLSQNANQYLIDMESREKGNTGIATLRIKYNRVHGYYIEIPRSQSLATKGISDTCSTTRCLPPVI